MRKNNQPETMENIRKHVNIKLVNNEKQAKKLASKPNFERCTIFDENFIAIHMKKTCIVYDKPVYLGLCILDLSKTLMYDFHYNYIKKSMERKLNCSSQIQTRSHMRLRLKTFTRTYLRTWKRSVISVIFLRTILQVY